MLNLEAYDLTEIYASDIERNTNINLQNVKVKGVLNLENCNFSGVVFKKGIFKNDVIFDSSIFNESFEINQVQFKGNLTFRWCNFKNKAIFIDSIFEKMTIFREAIFCKIAYFYYTVFLSDSSFQDTVFKNTCTEIVFKRIVVKANLLFEESLGNIMFNANALFLDLQYTTIQSLILKNVHMDYIAFDNINMKNIVFQNVIWPIKGNKIEIKNLASKQNKLNVLSSIRHYYEEEKISNLAAMFFVLEMDERLISEKTQFLKNAFYFYLK
jgi:uncharacterized protein YjbI with pentapeptide repeats